MLIERRYAELQPTRGRTLGGVAVRYGSLARIRHPRTGELMQERIEPDAFGDLSRADVRLDVQHDRARIIARTGGGLVFDNSPEALRVSADLPATRDADDALELVRTGVLRGLSVEFVTRSERREQPDIRVIERAALVSVGVVDTPAYPDSIVEARRRAGAALSGKIPYGKPLQCRCVRGPCERVQFQRQSFRRRRADTDEADADLDGPDGLDDLFGDDDEVLAIVGDYAGAIASKRRGTLILENTDDGLEWAITRLPDSTIGRDLAETARNVPLVGRPVFIAERQRDIGNVAHIERARLRAITIGATDATEGWTAAAVTGLDRVEDLRSAAAAERRRLWR